jgi:hypothetical protein
MGTVNNDCGRLEARRVTVTSQRQETSNWPYQVTVPIVLAILNDLALALLIQAGYPSYHNPAATATLILTQHSADS